MQAGGGGGAAVLQLVEVVVKAKKAAPLIEAKRRTGAPRRTDFQAGNDGVAAVVSWGSIARC